MRLDMAEYLVNEAGALARLPDAPPLMHQVNFWKESVPVPDLLALGMDPWQTEINGDTVLHAMSRKGFYHEHFLEAVQDLCHLVPDLLLARNHQGKTCLHVVGSQNLTKYLLTLPGADALACVKDRHGRAALLDALLKPKENALKITEMIPKMAAEALQETDANGWTALHWAVLLNERIFVELLVEAGASVNALDTGRRVPLNLAGFVPKSATRRVTLYNEDDVAWLGRVPRPCNVNVMESIQALLKRGAGATTTDKEGNLAFTLVASSSRSNETFVMLRAAARQGLFDQLARAAALSHER